MCFVIMNDTEFTLREFLNGHFHILNAINFIDSAWNQVSYMSYSNELCLEETVAGVCTRWRP